MLSLDPPLGHGDCPDADDRRRVATADSGPLRHRYGAARDLVVGMTVALSDGTIAKSGQRGMLDSTLVMCTRNSDASQAAQGKGRDDNADAFTVWLAGGGTRAGCGKPPRRNGPPGRRPTKLLLLICTPRHCTCWVWIIRA